jgi:DNA invertase Pin-like site-specific DNA recombinase
MKNIAYLRVSKSDQDINNQRLAILDYAQINDIKIHEFMEFNISSRKSAKERGIDALLSRLNSSPSSTNLRFSHF